MQMGDSSTCISSYMPHFPKVSSTMAFRELQPPYTSIYVTGEDQCCTTKIENSTSKIKVSPGGL